ncbi:MAG: RNA polymerase sigma factor [Isosphaeraceae bacterium]
MAHPAAASVVREIESLFDGSSVAGLTDRELLERLTARRDAGAEAAFAALVGRHGPMVLGICRQILGDRHHAEDAFQAVFLVLARKAGSIRNLDLVVSWLYGVALRTARKLKTRLSRQRKNEERDGMSGPGAATVVEPMVPPAEVSAMAFEQGRCQILAYIESKGLYNEFETDSEGRSHANPLSADYYSVAVFPPEGQPYLNVEKSFDWTKGALEHSIDFVLPRGAVIHGKVTEAGSGKALAEARVNYASRPRKDVKTGAYNSHSGTGPDGSFLLATVPGPGYLVVYVPSDDYVLQEIGSAMVQQGQPGGLRFYANAFVAGQIKPESAGWEVNVELRRGVTVEGQVIGPDGKRVQNASIISRVILEPYLGPYRFWSASYQGAVHDGHFELHGLDPDTEVPVFFLEPNRKLGATLRPFGRPPRYACRDRSDQLSEQSRVRRRRADCAARPDPGCDLPHHRSHERAQCARSAGPQGVYHQARRDTRPGRHPDSETSGQVGSFPGRVPELYQEAERAGVAVAIGGRALTDSLRGNALYVLRRRAEAPGGICTLAPRPRPSLKARSSATQSMT